MPSRNPASASKPAWRRSRQAGEAALAACAKPLTAAAWPDGHGTIDSSDYTLAAVAAPLRARIESRFPVALRELLGMATARLVDYQDEAYAGLFLDRIERVAAIDASQSKLTP